MERGFEPDDQQEVDFIVAQTRSRRLQVARDVVTQLKSDVSAATCVTVQFQDRQTQSDGRSLKREIECKFECSFESEMSSAHVFVVELVASLVVDVIADAQDVLELVGR